VEVSYCVGCPSCPQFNACPRAERAQKVDRRIQQWVGYGGTFLFMLGALALAVSTEWSSHPGPFAVFMVGHALWFWLGYLAHERPLLVLNGVYVVLDLVAVLMRL
jgi:hypothetical protein